jgi:hypothetical protein
MPVRIERKKVGKRVERTDRLKAGLRAALWVDKMDMMLVDETDDEKENRWVGEMAVCWVALKGE